MKEVVSLSVNAYFCDNREGKTTEGRLAKGSSVDFRRTKAERPSTLHRKHEELP